MTGDTSDAEGGRESRHRRDFSQAVILPFESVCIGWTSQISLVVPFKWKPLSGRQLEEKLSVGKYEKGVAVRARMEGARASCGNSPIWSGAWAALS